MPPKEMVRQITYKRSIYIDLEWSINQRIYLIGYAYSATQFGQLYGRDLTARRVSALLDGVDTIYFWGPDVGMLEKFLKQDLRSRYHCVNLLHVAHDLEPRARSYALTHFERLAGLHRTTSEYKSNNFTMHQDWKSPTKRPRALAYNREDVLLLIGVKKWMFKRHNITKKSSWRWSLSSKK